MIRGLSYDDRRLRDLPGEPLLATMVESAARCCGMGLIYEFWGVYEGLRDRTPKGVILQKGHALWASAFCPEAAAEIVDFLQWRQEGWVMLCPTLTALWRKKTGEAGLPLAVMELPEGVGGLCRRRSTAPIRRPRRPAATGRWGRFPLSNMKRRW